MNNYPLPDFETPLQIQKIELGNESNHNPDNLLRQIQISFVNAHKHKYTLLAWSNDPFLDLYVDCWKGGLFVCLDADFTNAKVFEVETNFVDNVRLVRVLDDDETFRWKVKKSYIEQHL